MQRGRTQVEFGTRFGPTPDALYSTGYRETLHEQRFPERAQLQSRTTRKPTLSFAASAANRPRVAERSAFGPLE